MSSDTTATKYAEALFGIGKAHAKLDVFQANADDFMRVLRASGELNTVLCHPNIRRAQRKEIITSVLATSGYDGLFQNFLKLVVERGRLKHYPAIVSAFMGLRDEADGRCRGVVYSATPLSAAQVATLRTKAQSKLGRTVILEERIDATLIGGIRLEIGGRVYDNSVKYHLERLSQVMQGSV